MHQKIRRFRFSRAAALSISGLAILAIPGETAGVASASVAQLPVTLSANGTGASATCNDAGDIVLNMGPSVGGYATAEVTSPPATVPALPPSFTTSTYAPGSPRWVIDFSNGNFVTGYPVQMGVFAGVTPTPTFTGNQWAVGNGSSYTTWSDALTGAGVTSTTTVKDAYVVLDGGGVVQAPATLTDAQYNGQPLSCASTPAPTTSSPAPSPTPSPSRTSAFPVGGVTTGGGKPVTSPWLPFGAGAVALALLTAVGAVMMRRRQQG